MTIHSDDENVINEFQVWEEGLGGEEEDIVLSQPHLPQQHCHNKPHTRLEANVLPSIWYFPTSASKALLDSTQDKRKTFYKNNNNNGCKFDIRTQNKEKAISEHFSFLGQPITDLILTILGKQGLNSRARNWWSHIHQKVSSNLRRSQQTQW